MTTKFFALAGKKDDVLERVLEIEQSGGNVTRVCELQADRVQAEQTTSDKSWTATATSAYFVVVKQVV